MKTLLLRALLMLVALSGLHCIVFLFLPWSRTMDAVRWLKIEGVPAAPPPIIEYWMLLMAAMCVVIGYFYLIAALTPWKHRALLPILGWSLVFMGAAAVYHGLRLGLPPWPYCADVAICALCGPGILWFSRGLGAAQSGGGSERRRGNGVERT